MAIQFREMIQALCEGKIEFILIGGFAANLHGAPRGTVDLDLVYRRTDDNLRRLVETIRPLNPYLRGAPPGLPFVWDERTLRRGLNFTLTTNLGDLDLLGEVAGGGTYEDLGSSYDEKEVFGFSCRVLNLEKLIEVKRAAGRPKDFEAIAELEAIWEERQKMEEDG